MFKANKFKLFVIVLFAFSQNIFADDGSSNSNLQGATEELQIDKKVPSQKYENTDGKLDCTIVSDVTVIEPCQPILIHFEMNNKLDHSVDYGSYLNKNKDYEFTVRDQKSNSIPRTAFGKRFAIDGDFQTVSFIFAKFEPDKPVKESFMINRLFDMSKNGKYTIQISQKFSDTTLDCFYELKSNALIIEVSDQNKF